TFRPTAPRWLHGQPRAAHAAPAWRGDADLHLPPRGILRELPPIRARWARPERHASREHLRRVEEEPRGATGPPVPELSHARPAASLARYSRPRDGSGRSRHQP